MTKKIWKYFLKLSVMIVTYKIDQSRQINLKEIVVYEEITENLEEQLADKELLEIKKHIVHLRFFLGLYVSIKNKCKF